MDKTKNLIFGYLDRAHSVKRREEKRREEKKKKKEEGRRKGEGKAKVWRLFVYGNCMGLYRLCMDY